MSGSFGASEHPHGVHGGPWTWFYCHLRANYFPFWKKKLQKVATKNNDCKDCMKLMKVIKKVSLTQV